jgi:aminoglycoside 6'-N-acetyltransferase I
MLQGCPAGPRPDSPDRFLTFVRTYYNQGVKPGRNPSCVRPYLPKDEAAWLRMRFELWPDSDRADADSWAVRQDAVTLIAQDTCTTEIVGFAEVGERPYADGCDTSPVAFLEGWFVSSEARRVGIGSKLVHAAVVWAQSRNLQELASDSILEDLTAYQAHLSAGFQEVERSIKYRLSISRVR